MNLKKLECIYLLIIKFKSLEISSLMKYAFFNLNLVILILIVKDLQSLYSKKPTSNDINNDEDDLEITSIFIYIILSFDNLQTLDSSLINLTLISFFLFISTLDTSVLSKEISTLSLIILYPII